MTEREKIDGVCVCGFGIAEHAMGDTICRNYREGKMENRVMFDWQKPGLSSKEIAELHGKHLFRWGMQSFPLKPEKFKEEMGKAIKQYEESLNAYAEERVREVENELRRLQSFIGTEWSLADNMGKLIGENSRLLVENEALMKELMKSQEENITLLSLRNNGESK